MESETTIDVVEFADPDSLSNNSSQQKAQSIRKTFLSWLQKKLSGEQAFDFQLLLNSNSQQLVSQMVDLRQSHPDNASKSLFLIKLFEFFLKFSYSSCQALGIEIFPHNHVNLFLFMALLILAQINPFQSNSSQHMTEVQVTQENKESKWQILLANTIIIKRIYNFYYRPKLLDDWQNCPIHSNELLDLFRRVFLLGQASDWAEIAIKFKFHQSVPFLMDSSQRKISEKIIKLAQVLWMDDQILQEGAKTMGFSKKFDLFSMAEMDMRTVTACNLITYIKIGLDFQIVLGYSNIFDLIKRGPNQNKKKRSHAKQARKAEVYLLDSHLQPFLQSSFDPHVKKTLETYQNWVFR